MSQGKVPTGRQPTGPRRSAPWTGAATSSRSRPPWCPVPREVLPAKGVSWPLGGGRPLRSRTEYTVPQCVRLLASPRHPGQGDGTDARPDDVGAEERGGGTNWHGASLQGRATPLCLLDQHHDVVGRDVDDSEVRGPGFSEDGNSGTAPVTQLPASNRVRPVQTASAYLGLSRRGTRKRNDIKTRAPNCQARSTSSQAWDGSILGRKSSLTASPQRPVDSRRAFISRPCTDSSSQLQPLTYEVETTSVKFCFFDFKPIFSHRAILHLPGEPTAGTQKFSLSPDA